MTPSEPPDRPPDPVPDPFPRMREIRPYPLAQRPSLVRVEDFCGTPEPPEGFAEFVDALPDIYAGTRFRRLVAAIAEAKQADRPVAVALGAHVLKVGLAPLLIDLLRRGVIDHVAMNGAGAIHDYEIAVAGCTSEDVGAQLAKGDFGFADETGRDLARAAARGAWPKGEQEAGFGAALGRLLLEEQAPHADLSVAAECARLGVPCTVHVSIGCDIVHMHPDADGAAIGQATMIDFRKVCALVHDMDGGVWINVGCAVVLPEVYLKAVSVALRLGASLERMTTANLDMLRQYRAETNVVARPPGEGLSILGQHELLLPLLRAAVIAELARRGWRGGREAAQ